jgi:hypothetical protein
MDRYYYNVPVLSIHEEKGTNNFSANPTLELLFAKNARTQIVQKNASSFAHQASNNKQQKQNRCAFDQPW